MKSHFVYGKSGAIVFDVVCRDLNEVNCHGIYYLLYKVDEILLA